MKNLMKKLLVLILSVFVLSTAGNAQKKQEFEKPVHVLVFSKTAGFRHSSISSGLKMLRDTGKGQNWIVQQQKMLLF